MRSGHSSSPNKRQNGSQSHPQGSTSSTGSQLLLAIVFTVFIVAFGYMFYAPAEEKVINSDSFYSLSLSVKTQGDKTPSHPGTTTPSTPSTPPKTSPDNQQPNQTHSTNTTKPPETTTPSHSDTTSTNTSTTETPQNNQTTPTEPPPITQPTNPPPVIVPTHSSDPHSISDGPTKEVIKNSGKRIRLDNPIQYEHIGYPSVQKESYIPHLEIQWTLYGPNHLSVVIRDADKDRFEIPFEEPYLRPRHPPLSELEDSNFELDIGTSPFSLKVKRRSTQEVIFELVDRLVYSDLYHEFTVRPPTKNYYGFGERTHGLQFGPGTYTLYIIDRSGHIDPGQPGYNTNGHQSMYLMAEKSKLYHLFLLRNTNSQEVVIKNNFDLTWKVVGGVLDFNFFLGETPEETVKLYHEYLGGWTLPALWHLGSHQCKWKGYKSVDVFQQVLEGYERVKLPLDGLWSDLDYTINEIPLTFDETKFPPQRTQELLKQYRKKWIPVINFYIPSQTESHAWTFPNVTSVAIRDGQDPSKPSPGTYYSGLVYFVDNFNPDSEAFWHQMYDFLSSKIPVSGLWLDANEVTTFMHINWPVANRHIYADHIAGDRNRKYYNLPFYPGNENAYDVPIVDVDAIHYGGIDEFNVRSYNNFHQSRHAYSYLQKRGFYFPLVLTRGNTMGSGQYAYHFTPDIKSLWDHFRVSTGQVYMYNIYGMPMVGADICGMGGEQQTAPELCARWYQVATFYGFARNHHQPQNYYDNNQEPHRYSGIYLESISASILLRYSILKQFNALFFKKRRGLRGTGTLMRPVFMEFPHDTGLPEYGHNMHEDQFMFDDFMLVAPAVYPGQQSVNAYIPNWRWFDLRDYKESALRGKWGEVSAKVPELPPHFLRGGRILFKQDTDGVMIAADLSNTFKMIVALNDLIDTGSQTSSEAYGHLMSASSYEEKYIYENCALKDCMLKATVNYELNKQDHTTNISLKVESVVPGSTDDAVELDEVHVLGLDPESLDNGGRVECDECNSGEALQVERGDNWVKIKGMKIAFKDGVLYNFKLSRA